MLQPVVRLTWAPRGETPVLDCWARRDRLSVISVLTVSPQPRRLGLYFDILDHNITADDFEPFVAHLLKKISRPITLVLDRWQVHRSGSRDWKRGSVVEWLPAYAPGLNPIEHVWSHTKHSDLANYVPDDALRLRRSVNESLRNKRTNQGLLRSFFHAAKLRL